MKQKSEASVLYDAALYLRLSRDDIDIDGSTKTESNSIGAQREMLRNFVKDSEDIQIFDIYVDDGYSGSNFERPEFIRMSKDIEDGKVNCVIVKDLSRFGREYIEAGRFIQKIYPALNVRFIAITDNFDSIHADVADTSLVLPMKNFINDNYCRDISGKVRSHLAVKREKGDYVGAFAPFGYQKSPDNKNQLIIDEYAADIVRKIFIWRIAGYSLGGIGKRLNTLHVPCPAEYRKSCGIQCESRFESGENPSWSATQVKRILTNEVYIGNMVQGKQEKISYKVKKRINKPKSQWDKVENTHEAIISENDFVVVQRLMKCDGRASKKLDTSNLFAGFLFCGDCGVQMIRRVNRYKGKEKVFYICATKNKGGECSRHAISEETLKTIVLKEIQVYTTVFVNHAKIMEQLNTMEINYDQVVEYDSQIGKMKEEYNKYYVMKINLLDDLKEGIIDREEYKEFKEAYEKKCQALQNVIEGQKEIIKSMLKDGVEFKVQLKEWKKSLSISELDRSLLALTVEKISIYENNHIEIVLRFHNEIEKMQALRNFIAMYACEDPVDLCLAEGGGLDAKEK